VVATLQALIQSTVTGVACRRMRARGLRVSVTDVCHHPHHSLREERAPQWTPRKAFDRTMQVEPLSTRPACRLGDLPGEGLTACG